MEHPYISHLESNVKGGVELEIGPKAVILGDNAGGKTSVVQTAQLALCGTVDDLSGKDGVKSASDIVAELAPPDADKLTAKATITYPDGSTDVASWRVGIPKPGTTKGLKHDSPKGVLLGLAEIEDVLTSSVDARRAFFLEHATAAVTLEAIEERITATRRPLWDRFKGIVQPSESPMDLLAAVKDAADRSRKSARRELRTAKSTLGALNETDQTVVEDIEKIQAELAVKEAEYKNLPHPVDVDRVQGQIDAIEAKIREGMTYLHESGKQEQKIRAMMADLPKMPDKAQVDAAIANVNALRNLIQLAKDQQASIESGTMTHCVLCGNKEITVEHVQRVIKDAKEHIDKVQSRVLEAPKRKMELDALLQKATEHRDAWQEWIPAKRAEIGQLQEKIDAAPESQESQRAVLWDEISKLNERIATAKEAKRSKDRRKAILDRIAFLEESVDEHGKLLKLIKKIEETLLAESIDQFCQQVHTYMPPASEMPSPGTFGIVLRRGTKKMCQVGLHRPGGAFHTSLSGAERTIVTVALACAIYATGDQLVVLLTRDRDLTPETWAALLRATKDAPCQIIVQTTTRPKGHIIQPWTLHEVTP